MVGKQSNFNSERSDELAEYSHIRIRPELRAEHVKRAHDMHPALMLYLDEKYDLGTTAIPHSFQKVGFFECLRIVALSEAAILEVPEPLWLRFAPKNFLILLVWKTSGLVKGRRKVAVTYAIENNDLNRLIWPSGKLPFFVVRMFCLIFGLFVRKTIDRIAFGSASSRDLYLSLDYVKNIPHKLIEELPGRPAVPASLDDPAVNGLNAIFVGMLDDRKGVLDLMDAWPTVERNLPEAVLTIVGDGKYAEAVSEWCGNFPLSRRFAGFVQHHESLRLLSQANVIIAPSRRFGRWREQIGLPIIEGLSAGLTVVTTDETGLASWLRTAGHIVISESSLETSLSAEIVRALRSPLKREDVIASLPEIQGRLVADSWLHSNSAAKINKGSNNEY
jgi:glycosyltransferase involved in cell wall biosynthesis